VRALVICLVKAIFKELALGVKARFCKNKITSDILQMSSHIGGAARGRAAPPWCVGPSWPHSVSSSDLWKLPGKIRLQELVLSISKNISCVAFLKHKNS
jgi:hypothetical protein